MGRVRSERVPRSEALWELAVVLQGELSLRERVELGTGANECQHGFRMRNVAEMGYGCGNVRWVRIL